MMRGSEWLGQQMLPSPYNRGERLDCRIIWAAQAGGSIDGFQLVHRLGPWPIQVGHVAQPT
jgi:hypothetical protein